MLEVDAPAVVDVVVDSSVVAAAFSVPDVVGASKSPTTGEIVVEVPPADDDVSVEDKAMDCCVDVLAICSVVLKIRAEALAVVGAVEEDSNLVVTVTLVSDGGVMVDAVVDESVMESSLALVADKFVAVEFVKGCDEVG